MCCTKTHSVCVRGAGVCCLRPQCGMKSNAANVTKRSEASLSVNTYTVTNEVSLPLMEDARTYIGKVIDDLSALTTEDPEKPFFCVYFMDGELRRSGMAKHGPTDADTWFSVLGSMAVDADVVILSRLTGEAHAETALLQTVMNQMAPEGHVWQSDCVGDTEESHAVLRRNTVSIPSLVYTAEADKGDAVEIKVQKELGGVTHGLTLLVSGRRPCPHSVDVRTGTARLGSWTCASARHLVHWEDATNAGSNVSVASSDDLSEAASMRVDTASEHVSTYLLPPQCCPTRAVLLLLPSLEC